MRQVQLAEKLYKEAQRRASEAGFAKENPAKRHSLSQGN
jgi:hypothetical protein